MKEYLNNIVIRIGEGQSPSGKILDGGTHWYNLENIEEAILFSINTKRDIYISRSNKKYRKITPEKLRKYGNKQNITNN